MIHSDAIKKLMPIDLGELTDKDISVEGAMLDNVYLNALSIIDEFFPSTALKTLERWESDYGIVSNESNSIYNNRKLLKQKVMERGGVDASYFISLAKALGYDIVITESVRPWIIGVTKVGGVVVSRTSLWTCTITVNTLSAPDLEKLLLDLIPPYLKLVFIYI